MYNVAFVILQEVNPSKVVGAQLALKSRKLSFVKAGATFSRVACPQMIAFFIEFYENIAKVQNF